MNSMSFIYRRSYIAILLSKIEKMRSRDEDNILSDPTFYWTGPLEQNSYWCERCKQKWGSRGLPPGKNFMTTPFRSLENAPFLESVLLTEAKDHDQ